MIMYVAEVLVAPAIRTPVYYSCLRGFHYNCMQEASEKSPPERGLTGSDVAADGQAPGKHQYHNASE